MRGRFDVGERPGDEPELGGAGLAVFAHGHDRMQSFEQAACVGRDRVPKRAQAIEIGARRRYRRRPRRGWIGFSSGMLPAGGGSPPGSAAPVVVRRSLPARARLAIVCGGAAAVFGGGSAAAAGGGWRCRGRCCAACRLIEPVTSSRLRSSDVDARHQPLAIAGERAHDLDQPAGLGFVLPPAVRSGLPARPAALAASGVPGSVDAAKGDRQPLRPLPEFAAITASSSATVAATPQPANRSSPFMSDARRC